MFSSGPLTVFTSSGVDVEILRWVPWTHRLSAATTPDRAIVYQMVEEADGLDERTLQTRQRVEASQRYRSNR